MALKSLVLKPVGLKSLPSCEDRAIPCALSHLSAGYSFSKATVCQASRREVSQHHLLPGFSYTFITQVCFRLELVSEVASSVNHVSLYSFFDCFFVVSSEQSTLDCIPRTHIRSCSRPLLVTWSSLVRATDLNHIRELRIWHNSMHIRYMISVARPVNDDAVIYLATQMLGGWHPGAVAFLCNRGIVGLPIWTDYTASGVYLGRSELDLPIPRTQASFRSSVLHEGAAMNMQSRIRTRHCSQKVRRNEPLPIWYLIMDLPSTTAVAYEFARYPWASLQKILKHDAARIAMLGS